MVQEDLIKDFCARLQDKNLLIKDLCARLPFDTMVHGVYAYQNLDFDTESDYIEYKEMDNVLTVSDIEWIQMCAAEVKPYLFPLSIMTEEQREEFLNIQSEERQNLFDALIDYKYGKYDKIPTIASYKHIDWLNANHFDYRGLIEKGLALDATGLNIY